jgi:hypothetical protein
LDALVSAFVELVLEERAAARTEDRAATPAAASYSLPEVSLLAPVLDADAWLRLKECPRLLAVTVVVVCPFLGVECGDMNSHALACRWRIRTVTQFAGAVQSCAR